MVSALQAEGADVWLYEWSSPEELLSQDIEQALWLRPLTVLTLGGSDIALLPVNHGAISRILRCGEVLAAYNPARLVLPLPIEPISAAHWQDIFGFGSPFGARTASPMEVLELVLTALRPQSPSPEPASPGRYFLIGQALLSQQRYEEALAWLLPLLRVSSPPRGVQAALAYDYARLKRWAECVDMGRAALDQAGGGLTAAYYALGLGFNGLGQHVAAEGPYYRALSTHPKLAGAWVGLGNALLHLGRVHEALLAFERGLAAAMDHNWNAWAYEDVVVTVEAQHGLTQAQQQLAEPPSSGA